MHRPKSDILLRFPFIHCISWINAWKHSQSERCYCCDPGDPCVSSLICAWLFSSNSSLDQCIPGSLLLGQLALFQMWGRWIPLHICDSWTGLRESLLFTFRWYENSSFPLVSSYKYYLEWVHKHCCHLLESWSLQLPALKTYEQLQDISNYPCNVWLFCLISIS